MKPVSLPPVGMPGYDSIDPFDHRYFDNDVAKYVSERSRIAYQAYVESALAHTLADFDICERKIAEEIESAASKIKAEDVYEEEKVTKHDIKALINTIKKEISVDAQPYVHFGATSYDIIANANVLQMKDVCEKALMPRMDDLQSTLLNLTEKYADTVQVGRTHGQHAVPITFGFAMGEYVSRLGESMNAIEALTNELRGKFSGAVGAYNALSVFVDDPLEFEMTVLSKLGLQPAHFSSQILPPEQMIRLIDEMGIAAGIMANLGHDMRHLQRSEIAEVRELFERGQTGSSTMAHKRNPWNFENVASLFKQVLAQVVNANLNISSEHQRDLTDSASSRFYVLVPAALANMADRLSRVMGRLEVDEEAMTRNLKLSSGAIAAEPLYLLFEKYGHTKAHEKAKELAHHALSRGMSLAEAVELDDEGKHYWQKFSKAEKEIVTDPKNHYTGLAAVKAQQIAKYWRSTKKAR